MLHCVFANEHCKVARHDIPVKSDSGIVSSWVPCWIVYPFNPLSMDEVQFFNTESAAVKAAQDGSHFHNVLKLKGVVR